MRVAFEQASRGSLLERRKDSCLAAPHISVGRRDDRDSMFAADSARSRSHGLRPEVIAAQVGRLGLESLSGECLRPTRKSTTIRSRGLRQWGSLTSTWRPGQR
jgi:hypothetical protein